MVERTEAEILDGKVKYLRKIESCADWKENLNS